MILCGKYIIIYIVTNITMFVTNTTIFTGDVKPGFINSTQLGF